MLTKGGITTSRCFPWAIFLVGQLFSFGLTSPVMAQSIGVDHLRIELDTDASRKLPAKKTERSRYKKTFKDACNAIGNAMMLGNGPWGLGAFGSFSCHLGSSKLSGPDRTGNWRLVIVDGQQRVSFAIQYRPGKSAMEVVKIGLAPSKYLFKYFKDDEFMDLLAYALQDAMPMAMIVTRARISGQSPAFSGRYPRAGRSPKFKYDVMPAPENLTLYRLRFDATSQLWRSEVVGQAKLSGVTAPTPRKRRDSQVLVGGLATYDTSRAVEAALVDGPLFAHDARGPGSMRSELARQIKEAQSSLESAAKSGQLDDFIRTGRSGMISNLLASAAAGYVGVRYGREVLPGAGQLGRLINKTSMFGLLVEVRGGPVKGLRYYYDQLPATKVDLDGVSGPVQASIGFSRHVLGFSWEFSPGFLVDYVTIDPKLGLWTFNATLPSALADTGEVSEVHAFNLGRTFGLGIEVGLEKRASWYTLRGWYALNTGLALIKSGGKVTSNRFGIDAFWTAGPVVPIFGASLHTGIMGFYNYESVTLTAATTAAAAEGESTISGISYTAGYAGGGVVLQW